VRTISDVHKLISQKQIDDAIYGLHVLRKKSPYNPYYPFLLGDLYCERGFYGDGLAKYREALTLSDGYRKRASIHTNAIRALGNDLTYLRARVLLERDLGAEARPALEAAAANDAEPVIAERARLILAQIAR
jgi:protein involved in temperature-dependent protein secretion